MSHNRRVSRGGGSRPTLARGLLPRANTPVPTRVHRERIGKQIAGRGLGHHVIYPTRLQQAMNVALGMAELPLLMARC